MLSWFAAPCAGRLFGFDLVPPLCTSRERRPKPDVGNLFREQAHAPLPSRAGHARMPPGLRIRGPSNSERGFHAPPSGFYGRQEPFGTGWMQSQFRAVFLLCSYKIPLSAHHDTLARFLIRPFGIYYHLTEFRIGHSDASNRRQSCTPQFIFSSEWASVGSPAE